MEVEQFYKESLFSDTLEKDTFSSLLFLGQPVFGLNRNFLKQSYSFRLKKFLFFNKFLGNLFLLSFGHG